MKKTELKTIVESYGFKKGPSVDSSLIYFYGIDERYSIGVIISIHKVGSVPQVQYGIYDSCLAKVWGKVSDFDMAVDYCLTIQHPLNYRVLRDGRVLAIEHVFDEKFFRAFIESFIEKKDELVEQYVASLNCFNYPEPLIPVENFFKALTKNQGVYFGFMFKLSNGERVSLEDIEVQRDDLSKMYGLKGFIKRDLELLESYIQCNIDTENI
ncbi:hypothetical protein A7985_08900 [Pseudoalteromonas luteoviolacea]|uniref:Uncharacterized protein n=1 Tax=Pseudoalteromonas luteoviolacea TaxID=43657 RepID=A0A1C0TRM7_9GAMM|nr:hypothetical protein [Pseudoalteromonas luteoviolacea]OCQ21917.1 hypothetical protein A7985_08900 [Pseudoalteromonas luteoviolacea]